MGNELKVLVAEDNPKTATMITDYLDKQKDITVIGVCENGTSTLDFLNKNEVDIVLLDMIMGDLDGIGVLEKSVYQKGEKKPKFIVLTALRNENMISRACDLGVQYYMVKPFDLNLLARRIREIAQSDQEEVVKELTYHVNQYSEIDEKISSIFLIVGIPAHVKGYQYLREAIKLVLEDNSRINKITKELYPMIAQIYDTTPSKVERAIRHAIKVAWNRGNLENLNQVFRCHVFSNDQKPTNGEFIALIAERLSVGKFSWPVYATT